MPDLMIRLFDWMDTSPAGGAAMLWIAASVVIGTAWVTYRRRDRERVKGLDGQLYRGPR